jgi:4-carboxymuconolactone decarboxylase
MDQKMHDKGPEVRKAVLGEAFVNNPLKNVDSSNKPFRNPLNEYCWGSVWGRDELPRKTRSMLDIAMISIPNRPHEPRGALNNDVTREEIREILMQVTVHGGMAKYSLNATRPDSAVVPRKRAKRARPGTHTA